MRDWELTRWVVFFSLSYQVFFNLIMAQPLLKKRIVPKSHPKAYLDSSPSIPTAVFISGRGSNLEALASSFQKSDSLVSIKIVVSNNAESKGLEIAEKFNIPTIVATTEQEMLAAIQGCKLVCLAGFMQILSGEFIKKAPPILNIHPSLLPKYKGLRTHQRAIEAGEKKSGCTVHWVTEKLDSGEPLGFAEVSIKPNDDAETLANRVLQQEHILYPKIIQRVIAEKML